MTWTFSKDRHQHARNNFSSLTNRMRVIAPRSITSNYVVTHDGQASRKLERDGGNFSRGPPLCFLEWDHKRPIDADHAPIVNFTQGKAAGRCSSSRIDATSERL